MAPKRKMPAVELTKPISTKRTKFTLDNIKFPELSAKGVVLVTGTGDVGQLGLGPDVFEKLRPSVVNLKQEIVDICAGGMHTVCLTKNGKVLTFGCNDEGALGRITDGKEDAEFLAEEVELPGKVIQISAGDSHTAALLDDGRVFAWGAFRDAHGSMGLSENGAEKLPYEILGDQKVVKIASGADHIVFLTNKGEVWTCGCAEQGQLGRIPKRSSDREARSGMGKRNIAKLISPAPISLKANSKIHFDNIWTGTYCTFAQVSGKKDIYVFGLNNYHQIGLDNDEPQYAPKLSKDFSKYKWQNISGSEHHSVGLTTDGKVYVIGRKEYGRLGLGDNCEDARFLTEVTALAKNNIVSITTGSSTSFAITEHGILYGWGIGSSGKLGLGDEEDRKIPTEIKSKQLADRKVIKVSGGGQHTVLLCSSENNNKMENGNSTKK